MKSFQAITIFQNLHNKKMSFKGFSLDFSSWILSYVIFDMKFNFFLAWQKMMEFKNLLEVISLSGSEFESKIQ